MASAKDQIKLLNASSGTHPFAPSKGKARENAEKETNATYFILKSLPMSRRK